MSPRLRASSGSGWVWRWFVPTVVLVVGVVVLFGSVPSPPVDSKATRSGPRLRSTLHGTWKTRPLAAAPSPRGTSEGQRSEVLGVDPPPRHAPEKTYFEVQVRDGENFWKLAELYLGGGEHFQKIADANPKLDPHRIRAGTRLRIPGRRLAHLDEERFGPRDRFHQVERGETLSDIARRYYRDGEWRPIYEANRSTLSDPDRVAPGTRLRIPARGKLDRP